MISKKNITKLRNTVKKEIYWKFGWTVQWWARQRGFSVWQMYDFLRGKAGRKTRERIIEALKKDGIEVENNSFQRR